MIPAPMLQMQVNYLVSEHAATELRLLNFIFRVDPEGKVQSRGLQRGIPHLDITRRIKTEVDASKELPAGRPTPPPPTLPKKKPFHLVVVASDRDRRRGKGGGWGGGRRTEDAEAMQLNADGLHSRAEKKKTQKKTERHNSTV